MVRVNCENIIGGDSLLVQITGMTGAHASKINGTYVSAERSRTESMIDPQSPAPTVGASAEAAAAGGGARDNCIHISGASGNNADFVNGIYDAINELSCGQCVYIKRGDPATCVHFWDKTGRWIITETVNKGVNNKGRALVSHQGSLDSACSLNTWEVVVNKVWTAQPDVRCAKGVGNFEGGLKKMDGDIWLEYHAGKCVICDAQDRRQGKGYLFCDADHDSLTGDCIDFHSFSTPWLANRPWYSTKAVPKHTMRAYSGSAKACERCGM